MSILSTFDHNKLRREREKSGKLAEEDNILKNQAENIKAIYYDDRQDDILTKVGNELKFKYSTKRENHYVIVAKPGSRYIVHVSPKSGKARNKATEILYVIRETVAELLVLGYADTPVNIGQHGGINMIIELE